LFNAKRLREVVVNIGVLCRVLLSVVESAEEQPFNNSLSVELLDFLNKNLFRHE